jgi:hypothetical protein
MKKLLDARVTFGDPDILDLVTKADMVRLLSGHGWSKDPAALPFGCELWKKLIDRDGEAVELLLVDRTSDRIARIGELVHRFHLAENIPTLRVITELLPQLPIGGRDEA